MKKIAYITEGLLRSKVACKDIPFARFMDLCSYRPKGYQFSPKFQDGIWDGKVRLAGRLKDGSYSFPTGLLHRIREFLFKEGFRIKRRTAYKIEPVNKIIPLKHSELRDYQNEAVKMALYHRRGIVKLPTAAGKSLIAASVIKSIQKDAILITNKKDLLYQTKEVFEREIGGEVGIMGDALRQFSPITIGSVPTLFKNFDYYKDFLKSKEVLIIDEVHHAVSKTWYKIAQKLPCVYRIGLTATPVTGADFIMLEACTGKIIYTKPAGELIEEGYLSKPNIFMVRCSIPVLPERYSYDKAYTAGIVQSTRRNQMVARLCWTLVKFKKYRPIVIQIRKLDHYKYLKTELEKFNLKYKFLSGPDSGVEREKVMKDLKGNRLDILIVSTIFDEAVDIPNIRTLIILSGGKDQKRTIQRLGRGMRRTKTKTSVLVIDFHDRTHDYLERHSKARNRTYSKEGHKVTVTTWKGVLSRLGLKVP